MKPLLLLFAVALFYSCTKESPTIAGTNTTKPLTESNWNIPQSQLIGELKPFPIINNPTYSTVTQNICRDTNSRVVLYQSNNQIYAFPNDELYIEAVNDIINNLPISITYCPITKSAIGINRLNGDDTLIITASGYLYKENMVPMDVNSQVLWSQMTQEPIKGELHSINNIPIVEVDWKEVVACFPDAKVFTADSVSECKHLPITEDSYIELNTNNQINPKTRYYGVVLPKQRVALYSYTHFSKNWEIAPIWINKQAFVIGNKTKKTIVAYYSKYKFEPLQNEYPIVMKDETNSYWNIFGEAVSGPRLGQKLTQPLAYVARGQAWLDLFQDVQLKN